MTKSRALTYHSHGEPQSVLHIEETTVPDPGPRQALVQMLASPVNPADINKIEGHYGAAATLPAIAGSEGVGIVKAIGTEVSTLRIGDQVLLPPDAGLWREFLNVDATDLFPLRPPIPYEDAAMLSVNPPTALRLLGDFVPLQPGDWVIQNAANSGVGRAIIQIARWRGLRTLSLVRRPELVGQLRRLGGDIVLLDQPDSMPEATRSLRGAPVRLALNAVGGDSALRLATQLAPGGTLVTYGAMGRQPLKIPNSLLIFRNLHFQGFWLTAWRSAATSADLLAMTSQLAALVRQGVLQSKIERIYPMARFPEALAHAQQHSRSGKILLKFNPDRI